MSSWTVTTPARLDVFLAEQLTDLSRGRIQKLIKAGVVFVNDKVCTKPSFSLATDDAVRVEMPEEVAADDSPPRFDPVQIDLPILYEDEACFVLNKPAGYAAHPGAGMEPDEVTLLHGIAYLFQQKGLPFSAESILVHRLDKETTGCILIAKTPEAHAALQKQFAERTVQKCYLALVAGVPSPPEALIDAPIGRNLTDRTKMSVLRTSVSREAQTTYKVLDAADTCALVQCELHTGRTHQVRVHMASIGHPLLGDTTYETAQSGKMSHVIGAPRVMLHAWQLGFTSLVTEERVNVTAEVPADFSALLNSLGLSYSS